MISKKLVTNDNDGHFDQLLIYNSEKWGVGDYMNKVTITDIAAHCNVSIKTVSRVLNGSENVSETTRAKVLNAMKEEGYQVNLLARGLKQQRMNIIIVFIDRHNEEHMSMWHNIMLRYLFSYAKEQGLKIIVSPSNAEEYLEDETDGFYLLSSGIADGAILLENIKHDKRVEYLDKTNTPYVVFGQPEEDYIYSVSLDNYDVGYKGGEYLVQKGYKNICFLVGEEKYLSNQLRIKGFKESLADSNTKHTIQTNVDTVAKAYEMSKEILQNNDFDAFFVSGDERALGVYKALGEMGKQIPDEIAVLGIDDLTFSDYLYPPMSSVKQDFKLLAQMCIDNIAALISKDSGTLQRQILIPASIVERKST